jgi:hypothetical protein
MESERIAAITVSTDNSVKLHLFFLSGCFLQQTRRVCLLFTHNRIQIFQSIYLVKRDRIWKDNIVTCMSLAIRRGLDRMIGFIALIYSTHNDK